MGIHLIIYKEEFMRLMKQLGVLCSCGVVAVLALGCDSGNPVTGTQRIEYAQGSSTTTVIVKVIDSNSGAPLDSVAVAISGGGSSQTESSGLTRFEELAVGQYMIELTRAGYEPVTTVVSVASDENSHEVPIARQTAAIYTMAKQGVSVSGKVYYQSEAQTKKAAASATVQLRLGGNQAIFTNPLRTTQTLPSGEFFFDNLPENTASSIEVLAYRAGGKSYRQTSTASVSSGKVGDTVFVSPIILTWSAENYFSILSHNLEDIKGDDSITITFSEAVDTAHMTFDSVYVTSGGDPVLVDLSWADKNKTLRVSLYDGTWSTGASYRLYIGKLRSTNGTVLGGQGYSPMYSFGVRSEGILGDVENVRYRVGSSDTNKIDYDTRSVTLLWSALPNASHYEIYRKSVTDSSWRRAYSAVADTSKTISTTSAFYNGGTLQFIVLGVNSESRSPVSSATVLTLRDEQGPVFTSSYVTSFSGFDRSSYSTAGKETKTVSGIPEALDTSKSPSITVIEGGRSYYGDSTYAVSPDDCVWAWTTQSRGALEVTIPAGEDGAYDTLVVDFSGLTDVAGNPVDTTGGGGVIKYHTRN